MDIYLKYQGNGHLPGVPARDLSREEAMQFGVTALLKSGLYTINQEKPKPAENKISRGPKANKQESEE